MARQPVALNLPVGSKSTRGDLQGQSAGLDKPSPGCSEPSFWLRSITRGRQRYFTGQSVYEGSWLGCRESEEGSSRRGPHVGMRQRRLPQEVAVDSPHHGMLSSLHVRTSLQKFCPHIQSLWLSHLKPGASSILF